MKTFSTSGTGSQQTLSEIESDKIPIYNSVADAEADLTNLKEGQIIAIITIGAERLAYVVNENGTKKIKDLTANIGTGAPVGSLISQYKKVPMSGYLYCDGSTFDETAYPALYLYLGSNVLPDYRECVMVGAEQNTTDSIATHDVYTQGEFKDDQMQIISGSVNPWGYKGALSPDGCFGQDGETSPTYSSAEAAQGSRITFNSSNVVRADANTDVTHGKQKAVYVYIKATSGLAENQQENVLNATKDYVDNSNSYSTSETLTGGKWIDGKPIYRKVVVHDVSGALTGIITIDHGVSNIETPIRVVCGRAEVPNSSNGITIPAQFDATTFIQLGTFRPDGLQLYAGSTNWTSLTHITVCVEYTKTTD